jgi:hypothetical protein
MSNPKAQAQYEQRRREIEGKLEKVQCMIETHRASAGDKLHWGHVGDLGRINELLDELLARA